MLGQRGLLTRKDLASPLCKLLGNRPETWTEKASTLSVPRCAHPYTPTQSMVTDMKGVPPESLPKFTTTTPSLRVVTHLRCSLPPLCL